MNISIENKAISADQKGDTEKTDAATLNINQKVKLNFLIRAVIAIGLFVFVINLVQRRNTIHTTHDKLQLLAEAKSKHTEDFFRSINQQLVVLSENRQFIDAFSQLTEAFSNIEGDNYTTTTAPDFQKMNMLVEGFYNAEVIPILGDARRKDITVKTLLTNDRKQRIFQYLYLAANSKPLGSKASVNKADDGSSYSYLHAQFHPQILDISRQSGISDVLYVDYKTGYVTYSLKKNLEFASNLFDGPYKNSGLGMAFKSAIGKPQGSVSYIDATLYLPALYRPCMFISAPVFTGSLLTGVIIFEVNTDILNGFLNEDSDLSENDRSLKTIIVGPDYLYRNTDPEFGQNKVRYLRKLQNNAESGEVSEKAGIYNTTALVQSADSRIVDMALKEKAGVSRYITETGKKVLCTYLPLQIDHLNWVLITQENKSDAMAPARRLVFALFVVALLIAVLLYYISEVTSKKIGGGLKKLNDNMVKLSKGNTVRIQETDLEGEFGQPLQLVDELSRRMDETIEFVNELSKGNTEKEFSIGGEDDLYGLSMNNLKHSLIQKREEEEKRKKEDEIRNWAAHGIAMFNDILRADNNNLEKLSVNIITNVVHYMSANQGGLFLMEEDENGKKYLNLLSSYAYNRQKFRTKQVEIGEGLVGTCVLEKKTILINKIPDNYIEITSGLGGSKPHCLLVVPLKKDEEVLGVVEIASFTDFRPHEVEFLEKVAESITSTLITVRLHMETAMYLERFQQQAEEMKSQDEEMRQSMEELQATHEEMERLKKSEDERNKAMMKELDDYRQLLLKVLDNIPGKIFVKDNSGKLMLLNSEVASVYNKTVDQVIGTTDFDYLPVEVANKIRQAELEIMAKGPQTYIQEETLTGTRKFLKTTKMPIYLPHLNQTGLLGIELDVTDFILVQEENKKKEDALQKEKALMDALMNNIPENIYFKDRESKFIRFSKSMLKLFGLERPEELIGKTDFDFFDEEHARPAYEDEQKIIRSGKAILDYEEKEVQEGKVRWVNTTKMPLYDTNGNVIGTFGITKDITHLKLMQEEAVQRTEELSAQEEELRQNLEEMQTTQEDLMRQMEENKKMQDALGKEKALMDALLNNIPENIYFKDRESRFIRFSKSMLRLFGLTKEEELIGKTDFDFFDEVHARPAFDDEQRIIKTGKAIVDLEEKEIKDGKIRWVNTTKMPLYDGDGSIIGTFGITKDITNLKRMQEEAIQRNEELSAQEEELRQNLEEMQTAQEDLMRQMEENKKIREDLSKENALMDALMNNATERIYFKDKDSRFIRVSKSLLKLFKLNKDEELVGKTDFDFFDEEHAVPAFKDEQRIIRSGRSIIDVEEKEVLDDGRIGWVNTSKMPLRDKSGVIIGTFGISKDITRVKTLELEAIEKNKTLEETKHKLEDLEKEMKKGGRKGNVTDKLG